MSEHTRQTTKGAAGAASASKTGAAQKATGAAGKTKLKTTALAAATNPTKAAPESVAKTDPAKAPAKTADKAPEKATESKTISSKAPAAKPAPAPAAAKSAPAAPKVAAAPDAKPQPKAELKVEPKPEPKSEQKSEQKSAPKPEQKPEPVAKPVPAAAAKPAPTAIPSPASISLSTPAPVAAPRAKSVLDTDESPLHSEPFSAVGIPNLPTPEVVVAPFTKAMEAGAEGARSAYASARETNEALGQACFESAAATTRGLAALNGQLLDLMRAHSDLSFSLMRSTLSAPSLSEAVRMQTSGARQAYETTATHLKAMAETTTRIVGEAAKPLHEAMTKR